MKVPKYVVELMERSHYEYDCCTKSPNYGAGYTISIQKHSEYGMIDTLKSEVERLCKWANRIGGPETAYLLYIPNETHHVNQSAAVTIFDPVMQQIEKYIPNRK